MSDDGFEYLDEIKLIIISDLASNDCQHVSLALSAICNYHDKQAGRMYGPLVMNLLFTG